MVDARSTATFKVLIWLPLLQMAILHTFAVTGLYRNAQSLIIESGQELRIPLILISHSGRSRSPIPVILIMLFTMPEEGTADSMTWRWTATTDG